MAWLCKTKIWLKSKIVCGYTQFHCTQTRFDTSNNELDRPLPKGKHKKVIELMKDELARKIITKFVGLRAKTSSYLIGDDSEDKKA